jgi:hypothetical protein
MVVQFDSTIHTFCHGPKLASDRLGKHFATSQRQPITNLSKYNTYLYRAIGVGYSPGHCH